MTKKKEFIINKNDMKKKEKETKEEVFEQSSACSENEEQRFANLFSKDSLAFVFERTIQCPEQEGIDFENEEIIKYRVKGSFLSENGIPQNIDSGFFQDRENPFNARKQAMNFFNNYVGLLIDDVKIDIQSMFEEDGKINGKKSEFIKNHRIGVEFTFNGIDFHEIDYYGIVDYDWHDFYAWDLETELEYYKKNNFWYENSQFITYCDVGEDSEAFPPEKATTFEILETSIDFSNKDKPYWWLSEEKKWQLHEQYKTINQIGEALEYGENHFIEFKPACHLQPTAR